MRSRAVALEQARDGVAAERRQENTERASDVPLRLLRSTIWRMERSGMFPKRVKVSVNVVAWREDEVGEWIRSKCS
jgi:hypothetical protein